MPPADPETAVKIVMEGVLMKLGDVLLMHAPSTAKKGIAVVVIMIGKRFKKTGGSKHEKRKSGPADR